MRLQSRVVAAQDVSFTLFLVSLFRSPEGCGEIDKVICGDVKARRLPVHQVSCAAGRPLWDKEVSEIGITMRESEIRLCATAPGHQRWLQCPHGQALPRQC